MMKYVNILLLRIDCCSVSVPLEEHFWYPELKDRTLVLVPPVTLEFHSW